MIPGSVLSRLGHTFLGCKRHTSNEVPFTLFSLKVGYKYLPAIYNSAYYIVCIFSKTTYQTLPIGGIKSHTVENSRFGVQHQLWGRLIVYEGGSTRLHPNHEQPPSS